MNQKKTKRGGGYSLKRIEATGAETDTGTSVRTPTGHWYGNGTDTDSTGTATDTLYTYQFLTNSNSKTKTKAGTKTNALAPDEITQVIDAYREILEPVGFLPLKPVYNSDKTANKSGLGLGAGKSSARQSFETTF